MTRILFVGDTAATGFGTVTADLGQALLERGEDVRFVSLNEQPDGELSEPFVGRTAVLGEASGWLALSADPEIAARTNARIETMFAGGLFEDGWTPESAIVLGDVGSLQTSPLPAFIPDGFPAFHYCPVEGISLPPRWAALWSRITPVAMSEFGADEIAKVTGTRPSVVYHGVDTSAFYQVSPLRPIVVNKGTKLHILRSKEDCKALFGASPDRVWMLRTDRFMPRKMTGSLLRSVAPAMAAHPELDLVLHCLPFDQGGVLEDETSKYPADIRARMICTGLAGVADRKILTALYNAADLYVSASAEGFGLCIAEAIACGTPAVGLDYSAVPEVIGPAGVTVPVGGLVDNVYAHFWARPDESKFEAAVEFLVSHKHRREQLGMLGPGHVARNFSWAKAAEQFSGLIAGVKPVEVAA